MPARLGFDRLGGRFPQRWTISRRVRRLAFPVTIDRLVDRFVFLPWRFIASLGVSSRLAAVYIDSVVP